ncbi:MAG: NAD(P)H-binding protein [Halioglobus sp.]
MSSQQRVLLIGATSSIGEELLRLLLKEYIKIRVLIRKPEMVSQFEAMGCEVFLGDIRKLESYTSALKNVDKLFCVYPDSPDRFTVERDLIDEAVRMNVGHVIKVSAYAAGLEPPVSFGILHAQADGYLQQSGLNWTILRPYAFMQNALLVADLIVQRRILLGPFGNARVSFVDAWDIAVVAKNVIVEAGYENKVFELTGPEAITYGDMAKTLSGQLGHRIRYLALPFWLIRIFMKRSGMSDWELSQMKDLVKMIRANGESNVTDTIQNVAKQPPRNFETFVENHTRFFKAG